MKNRSFLLTSILLGFVALSVHSVAYNHITQAQRRRAENVRAAYEQHTKAASDPVVTHLRDSGHSLNTVGLVFTFSCFVCLVVAAARHEPGWYSIPIMLLFFDVTMMLLL